MIQLIFFATGFMCLCLFKKFFFVSFVLFQISLRECFPVDTCRRFNVDTTSCDIARCRINVETTSCVYWVVWYDCLLFLNLLLLPNCLFFLLKPFYRDKVDLPYHAKTGHYMPLLPTIILNEDSNLGP